MNERFKMSIQTDDNILFCNRETLSRWHVRTKYISLYSLSYEINNIDIESWSLEPNRVILIT